MKEKSRKMKYHKLNFDEMFSSHQIYAFSKFEAIHYYRDSGA